MRDPVRGFPGGRRRRRRSPPTSRRRSPRSRRSGPGDGGAAVRRHRQRQDAGVPRGGAPGARRAGGARSCWCPRSALTPQTVSRFRGAFGDQVAVLHSALSDGERADAWRLLRRGERRVAVGARSADLRAGARTSASIVRRRGARGELQERRDAALPRARRGRGARPARGRRARARQRHAVARDAWRSAEQPAAAAPPARAHRRAAAAAGGAGGPARRAQGEPAPARVGLVGGARRGHRRPRWRGGSRRCCCSTGAATRRSCSAPTAARCGSARAAASRSPCTARRRASAATTAATRSRCPFTCRACANPVQQMRGFGTQQLERLLAERYPEARLARMDLDTTSTKWSHQRILGRGGGGRGGPPARHADDREGARLSQRDAGRAWWTPTPGSTCRTSARPSGRFSCWRRWRGARGGGPRAGGCWCRPGIRRTTRWSGRRSTTPRGSSREERALRESPPYPPTTALVNLLVSGLDEAAVGRARRGAGRLVRGAGGEIRTCR